VRRGNADSVRPRPHNKVTSTDAVRPWASSAAIIRPGPRRSSRYARVVKMPACAAARRPRGTRRWGGGGSAAGGPPGGGGAGGWGGGAPAEQSAQRIVRGIAGCPIFRQMAFDVALLDG